MSGRRRGYGHAPGRGQGQGHTRRKDGLRQLNRVTRQGFNAVHALAESELPTLREATPSALRLFRLVWRLAPYRTVVMVAGNFTRSLLPAIDLDIRARLLEMVTATVERRSVFDSARALRYLFYQLASLAFRSLIDELLARNQKIVNAAIARRLRHELLRVHLRLDLAALESEAVQQTLQDGVMLSQPGYVNGLVWSAFNVSNAVVDISARIVAASRTLSWHALPYFGLYSIEPLARMAMVRFRPEHAPPQRQVDARQRKKDVSQIALSPAYRREVGMLGIERWLLDEHDRADETIDRFEVGEDLGEVVRSRATGVILPWTRSLVYAALAYRAKWSDVSLADLHLIEGATAQFIATASNAYTTQVSSWQLLHTLVSYYRALELKPLLPAGDRVFAPHADGVELEFRDVAFAYPDRPAVLEGVSFTVRRGETVALVGHNGAGKSTLLKLMARLYDPSSGTVLIDGVDVRDYAPEHLRRQMAFGFADFAKMPLTARENVLLGDVDRVRSDHGALVDAARAAGAEFLLEDDVWNSRLSSLATEVVEANSAAIQVGFGARQSELLSSTQGRPMDLSTGQWAKISLARVFLRRAKLVVLDEPSAALDPEAEHALFTRLKREEEKTLVFVTHRMNVARAADRVVFLHEGRVAEQGTHDELLALGGQYAHFYNLYTRGF